METWQYFATLVVSFLGLFVGMYLTYITKEEMPIIKRWLILSKFGLILTIGIVTSISFHINVWISILFLILVAITVYHIAVPDFLLYTILGIIFYTGVYNLNLFFMNAVFIFAIGMPIGTLITEEMLKEKKIKVFHRIFLYNMIYILLAGVLYFVI